MPTCFLVLGTPRSGTSLVAGVLHYLGVRMGEYLGKEKDGSDHWDWGGPNEWNPKGFFEDAAFVNFGFSLYGFPYANPRRLIGDERTALSAIIQKRAGVGVNWGAKEPTLAFYLLDFIELCPDPVKLLVVERQAAKSIASWKEKSGQNTVESTVVIETADAQVKSNVAAVNLPKLTVQFDDLIDKAIATVNAIAQFVGKPVTDAARNLPDASLRHY